ncbi:fibronectin type III domain-containing protein [Butyrivibrio sp. FC2001]|uniref:fibronectin type III domain-containing protein n=1 Tax=Butyrivibrio sp. FC2001 TaxID=1280671 RepID=UPI000425F871|nr:fibronectin type III domain-containing protein [Butyrivibrio sp. FC2001]
MRIRFVSMVTALAMSVVLAIPSNHIVVKAAQSLTNHQERVWYPDGACYTHSENATGGWTYPEGSSRNHNIVALWLFPDGGIDTRTTFTYDDIKIVPSEKKIYISNLVGYPTTNSYGTLIYPTVTLGYSYDQSSSNWTYVFSGTNKDIDVEAWSDCTIELKEGASISGVFSLYGVQAANPDVKMHATLKNCKFTNSEGKVYRGDETVSSGRRESGVITYEKEAPSQDKKKPDDKQDNASNKQNVKENSEIQDLPSLKLSSVKAKDKTATVKWKKISSKNRKKISKVEIQYSTDKSFESGKKTKYVKKSATSKKIKGLKKGKTYYFRIRTYKAGDDGIHVSKWSKVKKVKIKKG